MIVIISIAEDVSTNDVIDWILHFEGSFFRDIVVLFANIRSFQGKYLPLKNL